MLLPSLATSLHVCKRDILRPSRGREVVCSVSTNHTYALAAARALSKDPKTQPKQRRPPARGRCLCRRPIVHSRDYIYKSLRTRTNYERDTDCWRMGSSLPTYVMGWETVTTLQLLPTTYVISTGCWTIFEALGRSCFGYCIPHNSQFF
jgi:hypothetical protein